MATVNVFDPVRLVTSLAHPTKGTLVSLMAAEKCNSPELDNYTHLILWYFGYIYSPFW